jgi:exonuclease SbcD
MPRGRVTRPTDRDTAAAAAPSSAEPIRLIHTSDWHLGRQLGSFDRLPDQIARIQEIADHAVHVQADLLLVAGDVIDRTATRQLASIAEELGSALMPLFAIDTKIVFLAGNHDRDYVFTLASQFGQLAGGVDRVRFIDRPTLVRISTKHGPLQLVALPYPDPVRYVLPDSEWPSVLEKDRALGAALRAQLVDLTKTAYARSTEPIVIMGHFLLQGLPPGICGDPHESAVAEGALPDVAYVALGHIHRPQSLRGGRVRYSGGIERLDLGEAHDQRQIVLVELVGRETRTTTLPLHATAIEQVIASTQAELETAAAELDAPARTFVALELRLHANNSAAQLQERARALFPHLYQLKIVPVDENIPPPASDFIRADPAATVMAYLGEKLVGDPERDAVLILANELLTDDEAVS